MNTKIENISKKIIALLKKTEENGASLEEAKNAMEMANKLMAKYDIAISELKFDEGDFELYEFDYSTKSNKTIFNIGFPISKFCNVLHLTSKTNGIYKLKFYGRKSSNILAKYYFDSLIIQFENSWEKYKSGDEFLRLNKMYHGKTLRLSFETGFVFGIQEKIMELIAEREKMIVHETGLMVVNQYDLVKQDYLSKNKVKTVKPKLKAVVDATYNSGFAKGQKAKINTPIENK